MIKIGSFIRQPQGYKAFIPETFPPEPLFNFSKKIIQKANEATLYLGKLDRFFDLEILEIKDKNVTYGRSYIYQRYVDIFRE